MITDNLAIFADALAVTDTDSSLTYSYDCGNVTPKNEVGNGEPLCLVFSVDVAAAGSTDTTDFKFIQSANADLSSPDTLVTRRIANANLTAGSQHVVPIAQGCVTKRYIGGRVELGTGDTITISCALVPQSFVGLYKSYADSVDWS